ncbi:hypothetical protein EDD91_7474 [Streptomyces sp. KS 21]|nr:hypothetical protein EDD91_7474 [Streptomyces sp. KS 21]
MVHDSAPSKVSRRHSDRGLPLRRGHRRCAIPGPCRPLRCRRSDCALSASRRGERSHRRGGRTGKPDLRPPTPAPTRRVGAPPAYGFEARLTRGPSSSRRGGPLWGCSPISATRAWALRPVSSSLSLKRSLWCASIVQAGTVIHVGEYFHPDDDMGRFSCSRHARSLGISSNHWNGGPSICMKGVGLSDRPEVDGPDRGKERLYVWALHRMAIHMNSDIRGAYYVAPSSIARLALPLEIA